MPCNVRVAALVISLALTIQHASLGDAGGVGRVRPTRRYFGPARSLQDPEAEPCLANVLRGGGERIVGDLSVSAHDQDDLSSKGGPSCAADAGDPRRERRIEASEKMSARPLLLAQDGTVEDPQECFRHSQILAAAGFIHPRAPVLLQVGGRPALKGVRASAGGGDGKSLSGKSVPGAYRGEKGPRLLFAGARAATAKLVGKLVANGALRAAFLFLTAATLGPRLPPVTFALPFFDGWFLRLTDHARSTTCAVIIGAMKLPMQRAFTDHYVCLSYSSAKLRAARPARPAPADHPLRLRSAHAFPGADEARLSVDGRPLAGWSAADRFDWQAPAAGRCADFEWEARLAGDGGSGSMRVLEGGRRILLSCDLPEGADARMGAPPAEGAAAGGRVSLEAEIRAPREWGAGWETREAGPEGWLGRTGLLPCRYFVQSTGSEARYRLTRAGARGKGRETVSGSATAHVESNYGTAFPRGWVYAQVSGAQPGTSLLLVGGKFRIGLAAPVTWLAALRSPALSIDLRTTDGHAVRARFSCAARRVQLEGSDRAGARLEVTVEDCATLHARDAVWVPTLQGFSNAPGCSESFAAVARVKAWRPGPPGSHHDRPPDVCQGGSARRGACELLTRRRAGQTLPLAALEFGGEFQGEDPAFQGFGA